jgi:hypothetical protein
MELKTLKNLLSVNSQAIKKYDIEQLRLILGVARYFVRSIEREINHRETSVLTKDLKFL